jgi:sodium-dependent dicarboxylate transporter 2/3/5
MDIETQEREEPGGRFERGETPERVDEIGRGGTYRTLDEQAGRLSPAEERFERRRRTIGLCLGPAVFAAMLLIPFDLEPNQHRLAAILAFVIVWWVTEAIPIPVTAVLAVVLCALLEATPPPPEGDSAADVVFGLFSDDAIFLFIGSFIIAQAMVVHGLHRRLAYRVLSLRGWAARPTASSSPSA